jgi:G-protein signaling modulator 1
MSFLDILSRMQSNRLDDQRCSIKSKSSNGLTRIEKHTNEPCFKVKENKENSQMPTEDFFNLIVKTQQNRLQDQRSHLATPKIKKQDTESQINGMSTLSSTKSKFKALKQAITVPPNDEFFSMIQKIQSRRLDEQRSNSKLKLKLKKF